MKQNVSSGSCFAVEEFQKLQEAKEVLVDEKKRKSYDLWLRSPLVIRFSEWHALGDSVKTVSVSQDADDTRMHGR